MGFVLGYVLGFAFGIALVVGFARQQNSRAKRRTELAAAVAALARMNLEDSKKLLADRFPSWVVFKQRQKLPWLNSHLKKIWPYVDEAASEMIRDYLEAVLEQYRPTILESVKFSKFTIGSVAPEFTGVSITEGEHDQINMELELQWDGTPKIVLDIKTKVGPVVPIQAKNIGFAGVFKLTFRPLVEEFPCFGAVCFSLIEKKNLDLTSIKVVGGDVSTIPGISGVIEELIRDAVEASIMWPARQVISILPGDYSYLEVKPVGTLEVKLIEAKELTNKDIIGKSDPFAKLFVRPLRDRTKTSKTINNETNPIWNENFEFVVEDVPTQHFTIRVYDDEGIQPSEFIGGAQFPLSGLEVGEVKDVWLKLVKNPELHGEQKKRGEVHLELHYCPLDAESKPYNPFDPNFRLTTVEKTLNQHEIGGGDTQKLAFPTKRNVIIRGVFSVTVISADNLPSADLLGKSDPFVVLTMKKSEQTKQTRVLNDTLNPTWNQTFDFLVEDGLHEFLILEVYDHDTFGKNKLGRCIMTLTRAMLEGEFTESFHLDGTESGRLNLYLRWTPQPILLDR